MDWQESEPHRWSILWPHWRIADALNLEHLLAWQWDQSQTAPQIINCISLYSSICHKLVVDRAMIMSLSPLEQVSSIRDQNQLPIPLFVGLTPSSAVYVELEQLKQMLWRRKMGIIWNSVINAFRLMPRILFCSRTNTRNPRGKSVGKVLKLFTCMCNWLKLGRSFIEPSILWRWLREMSSIS